MLAHKSIMWERAWTVAEPARSQLRVVSGQGQPPSESPPVQPAGHVQTLKLGHGQRLTVEGERTQFDFYGGQFYLASTALSERLPYLGLSATQYDIWHTLLGVQHRGGVITMSQGQIAEKLGTDRKEVGDALRCFARWGLIWRQRKGRYRINPRIAFYGKSQEQEAALADMPPDVPPITLPDVRVRPPRRRRKPKGV